MDTSENETSIRMAAYLAVLERQPTVIRHFHRTPDGVTLRRPFGDDQWSIIGEQPTKQLP